MRKKVPAVGLIARVDHRFNYSMTEVVVSRGVVKVLVRVVVVLS